MAKKPVAKNPVAKSPMAKCTVASFVWRNAREPYLKADGFSKLWTLVFKILPIEIGEK